MNALVDKLIPVVRKSGAVEKVSALEITTKYQEDPIIEIAYPRPDFNKACVEFLIGIYQYYLAPDINKHNSLLTSPPSESQLKKAVDVSPFDMSVFMQDDAVGTAFRIGILLPGAPAENTVKLRKDFLSKDTVSCMCPSCAFAALYSRVSAMTMGGPAFYTSIRYGSDGYVTMIIKGDTLWETVWNNVIPDLALPSDSHPFPWVKGYSLDHPLIAYFELPWKIKLGFTQENGRTCGVCGEKSDVSATAVYKEGKSTKRANKFHLLSPMNEDVKKGGHASFPKSGLSYYEVYKFLFSGPPENIKRWLENNKGKDFKLWAHGLNCHLFNYKYSEEVVVPVQSFSGKEKALQDSLQVMLCIKYAVTAL